MLTTQPEDDLVFGILAGSLYVLATLILIDFARHAATRHRRRRYR